MILDAIADMLCERLYCIYSRFHKKRMCEPVSLAACSTAGGRSPTSCSSDGRSGPYRAIHPVARLFRSHNLSAMTSARISSLTSLILEVL